MHKTIVFSKRQAILTGLAVSLVVALGFAAYRSLTAGTGSDLLPASVAGPITRLLGGTAKPTTQIAETLATADGDGELYGNPGHYADWVTPELLFKLQVMASQVLPQMQAIHFQSSLVSIEGVEVEELEDGRYRVLVHGKVEVRGDGIPQQVLDGTATVVMAKVDGRWLAADYRSFGSEP